MLSPIYTNQFKRDLKKMLNQGKDSEKLKVVMELLMNEEPLPQKHRDHKSTGIINWWVTTKADASAILNPTGS